MEEKKIRPTTTWDGGVFFGTRNGDDVRIYLSKPSTTVKESNN